MMGREIIFVSTLKGHLPVTKDSCWNSGMMILTGTYFTLILRVILKRWSGVLNGIYSVRKKNTGLAIKIVSHGITPVMLSA